MDKSPESDDQNFEQQLEAVMAAERSNRLKWGVIGLTVATVSVGLFVLFAEYRTFFFRPKPNMEEIKKVAFDKTNDPACRTLLDNVDKLKDRWEKERAALRPLYKSTDVEAIAKGRQVIAEMLDAYALERRRREIILTKEPRSQTELAQYFRHVIFFLKKMDKLLAERVEAINNPAAAQADAGTDGANADAGVFRKTDAGTLEVALNKPKKEDPDKAYDRSWKLVTEDHDKWRIYRQGPVPCGQRDGDVPPVPDEAQKITPTRPADAKAAPKAPAKAPAKTPSEADAGQP